MARLSREARATAWAGTKRLQRGEARLSRAIGFALVKIKKSYKVIIISFVAILGAYLLGYDTTYGSRPITLEEYKAEMSPEDAATVTEANLLIDGERLQIMTRTYSFSFLWMVIGAICTGGITWGIICLFEKNSFFIKNKPKDLPTSQ